MVEVAEKSNGAGDATTEIQTNEKDGYNAQQIAMHKMVKEFGKKLDMNVSENTSPDMVQEASESEETAEVKAQRQVVRRGVSGKIKWFNVARGYGFIERNDNEQDVFLHQSAVVRRGRKPRYSLYLKGGEEVEFDVVEGVKGLEAAAVSAPGGIELYTINPRHPRKTGLPDQRRNNSQRRPFRQRPGYKGARKNYRKQTDSDQKTGDDSDREMVNRRRENSGRRNRSSSKTSDSEVANV